MVGDAPSTNREEYGRAPARCAAGSLLVGGLLCEHCGEPRLFFRADPRSRRMGVSFDYPKWKIGVDKGTDAVAFRLDETDKARALAEACGFADMDMPNLKVDMPDALKLAVERENLAVAAAFGPGRAPRAARTEEVHDSGRRLAGLGLRWLDEP